MTRPRVLVALRPNGQEPPRLLEKAGHLADFVFVRDAGEVGQRGGEIDAAFVWNFRSTVIPEAIDRLPRLSWVHVAAVGVDASLSEKVRQRNLTFTNSRGVTAEAMAEYALALMLAHAKQLNATFTDQSRKVWRPRETKMLLGRTAVLVGVGAVNRGLAARLVAMGMTVYGVGRVGRRTSVPNFAKVVGKDQLLEVLPEAEYVVLATPLTDDTRGMIAEAELEAMPTGAVIINLGRGPVIEEAALMASLRDGHLGGALLDVVWREPLEEENELWERDDVILSPHMSADFEGWEDAMVDLFVDNLRRRVQGRPLVNVVDLALGYAPFEA